MRFVTVSFVAVLCLINSVYGGGDHHHASSSARHSSHSKSTHSHYSTHSYTYSRTYTYSHTHHRSHSHSQSASNYIAHATHAPIVVHGRQIEKRNIIDFFKRLVNPKSNDNGAVVSASTPIVRPNSSASTSIASVSGATKKIFAMLQDDPHASVGFDKDDVVPPIQSATPSASHAMGKPSDACVSSRRRKNVSLSSLFSKASAKASAYASSSASLRASPSSS